MLKKTDLVLFLNKCDILRAKLASGIRLADYIVSYGSRPNDFESASVCETISFAVFTLFSNYYPLDLRKKFAALLKDHSPERHLYCHFTSVTVRQFVDDQLLLITVLVLQETKSTTLILENGVFIGSIFSRH